MGRYFAWDYDGAPLDLFGPVHVATLVALAFLGRWVVRGARGSPRARRVTFRVFVLILFLNEGSWHVWNLAWGRWAVDRMLPLHLCSIMIWVSMGVLLTEKRRLYPLVYFLGVAGGIQALITPDAGVYGFPHFRYFQTMIAHGGVVIAGLLVVFVEGYRPSFRDALRVLAALNAYALIVGLLNPALGSNYLYLAGKPDIATALDYMPPWPWYILILEGLALMLLLLLALPFRRSSPP